MENALTIDNLTQYIENDMRLSAMAVDNPYLVSFAVEYGEPMYSIRIGGVGCMPMGDITAIKAKAKSGKSTFMVEIMACLLGAPPGVMECAIDGAKVLYIDTEQSKCNTARGAKRAAFKAGLDTTIDHPQLRCLNIREMDKTQRIGFIEQNIQDMRPTHLFIDGARDLITDFNDIADSSIAIDAMLRWCAQYEVCIVTVLHENKGKDDSNMRGHLGTELLNKCTDVFRVERKNDAYRIEQTDTRNMPVPDIVMEWIDGRVYVRSADGGNGHNYDETALRNILSGGALRHNELKGLYMDAKGCSERSANYHFNEAIKAGFLKKSGDVYSL